MTKKKTTAEFIAEARAVHGDKFSYSDVTYVSAKHYVDVICHQHGHFLVTPDKHIRSLGGCKLCRYALVSAALTKEDSEKNSKADLMKYRLSYHHANKHMESYKAAKQRYAKKRYAQIKNDPEFRMRRAMRSMLNRTLRKMSVKKLRNSETMLGYSVDEFRSHVSGQFSEGMSWSNHGLWHIDHVIPLAAFVEAGITEAEVINALANIRPLWAKDNFAKSSTDAKLMHEHIAAAIEFAKQYGEVSRLTISPDMVRGMQ